MDTGSLIGNMAEVVKCSTLPAAGPWQVYSHLIRSPLKCKPTTAHQKPACLIHKPLQDD